MSVIDGYQVGFVLIARGIKQFRLNVLWIRLDSPIDIFRPV